MKTQQSQPRNIGIPNSKPVHESKDKKDPFYGTLKVRGRIFVGTVVSDKAQRTVTVQWEKRKFLKKYNRYALHKTKVHAHNPDSMNAKLGDVVKIGETRPLSKTKHFVVIEIITKATP